MNEIIITNQSTLANNPEMAVQSNVPILIVGYSSVDFGGSASHVQTNTVTVFGSSETWSGTTATGTYSDWEKHILNTRIIFAHNSLPPGRYFVSSSCIENLSQTNTNIEIIYKLAENFQNRGYEVYIRLDT